MINSMGNIGSIIESRTSNDDNPAMDYSENVIMYPEALVPYLEYCSSINPSELYNTLLIGYPMLLDSDFMNKHKSIVANAFSNINFVNIFSQIMNQEAKNLNRDQLVICNKIIYDYFTCNINKDQGITNILYNIGYVINIMNISNLLTLGIDQTLAIDLAVAKDSTDKDDLAVKRVNVIITNSSLKVMTEQMIVDIYCKLFNNISPLFIATICDKWEEDNFISEEQEEIYSLINLAILDLLNSMSKEQIRQVLSLFAQTRQYLYAKKSLRFSIYEIAQSDYGRILEAIDELQDFQGITVPRY